jgi:hypothetical protein
MPSQYPKPGKITYWGAEVGLVTEGARPALRTVYLYRGDFLIPDKSSVSLRLEDAA